MGQQKIDDKQVEQLLRSGWTQGRVVEWYKGKGIDVTQSAISQAISAGRIKVDTNRNAGAIPWKLKPEHRHLHAARMLRTLARMEAGREIGVSLQKQVKTWREGLELENSVITYDPDTPEGFWRVPRRPGIDLGWVRDPNVSDDGVVSSDVPH
jgi:hypothetical protein